MTQAIANPTAHQLARIFAADVHEKTGQKPTMLSGKAAHGLGHSRMVKALVVLEGTGDAMIELTLTGKYMTTRFFLEPINSYEIAVYERRPKRFL